MSNSYEEFQNLRVTVDDVMYLPTLDAPPEKPHPFVYYISIHNDSALEVMVLGRKWILKEDGGDVVVVEGARVVGQIPVIPPTENFSYNSYHVVAHSAVVTGSFFVRTALGEKFYVLIPEFRLDVPKWV